MPNKNALVLSTEYRILVRNTFSVVNLEVDTVKHVLNLYVLDMYIQYSEKMTSNRYGKASDKQSIQTNISLLNHVLWDHIMYYPAPFPYP